MPRSIASMLVLLMLFCASGAQCNRASWPTFPDFFDSAPRVLSDAPSAEQIVAAINANTSKVQSLATANATISMSTLSALKANIVLERPRRFRLKAGTDLFGPEIDLGSNDELFWIWVRRSRPAELYWCRHDQYAQSAAKRLLPVEPAWLIEALGLVMIDPASLSGGPFERRGNRLEIRSDYPAAGGPLVRITRVDRRHGWIMEQYLVTRQGLEVARAVAQGHRYDSQKGVALPTRLQIEMPPVGLALKIDLGSYTINHLAGDPNALWAKPSHPGYQEVDLANNTPPRLWTLEPVRQPLPSQPPHQGQRRPAGLRRRGSY